MAADRSAAGRRFHLWDDIRERPTTIEEVPSGSRGVHESVLRSFQTLEEVKRMLAAGDSTETIYSFIRWVEA